MSAHASVLDAECAICTDTFAAPPGNASSEPLARTRLGPCGHANICVACIFAWLSSTEVTHRCPICRGAIADIEQVLPEPGAVEGEHEHEHEHEHELEHEHEQKHTKYIPRVIWITDDVSIRAYIRVSGTSGFVEDCVNRGGAGYRVMASEAVRSVVAEETGISL